MTPRPLARLRAVAGDTTIVLLWAAVAGAVCVVLRLLGAAPTTPAGWDGVAFVTLVLPVAATHAVVEARRGATPGKRWVGLAVVARSGPRPSPGTAAVRAAVKFAPWQLAHSAVFRLVDGSQDVVWLWLASAAQGVVVVSAVLSLVRRDGRALHDLVAGTRVVALRAAGTADSGASVPTA